MHANNVFSKRRPEGWVERRRRFERLFNVARTKVDKPERRLDEAPKPKR